MFDPPADRSATKRTRSGWWLGPELAVLAALLVLSIPSLSTSSGERLKRDIGQRAAAVIEVSTPDEHRNHGHDMVDGADHVVCGLDVFGTEPREVESVEDVKAVYGYYFCAVGPEGTPYLDSSRVDGPVVIQFGTPPVIRIARHGEGYEGRVRAMMPDEYEPLCFGGLRNDAVAAEVRRRFTDLSGAG
jgi:hypothetical protein